MEQLLICLGRLAHTLQAAVNVLHVGQDQLEVNGLDITRRIDRTVYVHNVVVVKAAYFSRSVRGSIGKICAEAEANGAAAPCIVSAVGWNAQLG